MGGNSTLQKYGKEFYSKIGKLKKGKKSPGSTRWGKSEAILPIAIDKNK